MTAIAEPIFAPGVYDDLPMEQYHSMRALSSSGLKKLLRSPAHYLLERTKKSEPTDSMRFGTAVHTLLLEPERADELVEMPEFNARTKDGRAERDVWLESHAGKQAFDAKTLARIRAAAAAVRAHPGASMLLSGGVAERSILWRDEREGIECRARFDFHREDGGIVDVKTTADASPAGFMRTIGAFGYHQSAAHYWLGHEHVFHKSPAFWAFVVVESEPPHGVATYVLDAASIRAGMDDCARAYKAFRICNETGHWPAYPETIEPISAPRWALRKEI